MSSSPTESPVATGGALDVLMPQMGTSMVEGTIVVWRVAVGDRVRRDDVVCEVSTDKIDVECPAPHAGVVAEILVEAGETVDVGTVIARLAGDATAEADAASVSTDAASAPAAGGPNATTGGVTPPATEVAVPAAPSVPAGTPDGHPAGLDPRAARRDVLRRSSPVAARLAAEHGIDVRALSGSGRGGRVTKRDVLAAADGTATRADGPAAAGTSARADGSAAPGIVAPAAPMPDQAPAPDEAPMHTESPYRPDPSIPTIGAAPTAVDGAPAATSGPTAPGTARPATAPSPSPGGGPRVAPPADLGGVPAPASRMRRAIGDAVRRSLDTAAHCTTVVECDMGRVERERREQGLTALPLVARAAIETLRAFPALNATFDGETITRYGDRVHLGIAVSLGEDGLIAPVVHDAQDLSAQGLARRIRDLAARARSGDLHPDEVRGGTFTITNPGAAGALIATPVINQPQVAILDLEAIVRRPVVVTDAEGGESIGIRPMVHLCLGWDHRALDGLYAAQFLTALRGRLEG